MIEPTDEMIEAFSRDAGNYERGLAAVLAIVERDYTILPRGAQALTCRDHPDVPARWGTCPTCLAELPPEERT